MTRTQILYKPERAAVAARRMPAEWEPHECCWMAWPMPELWGDDLAAAESDYAAIARAIARFEPVRMLADPTRAAQARRMLGRDIEVIDCPLEDAWLRDTGPSFVLEQGGALAGVDWRFNGWGGANEAFVKDAALARFVLARAGARTITSALAMEGGAIAVDGAGTLLATDTVTFNANRNPGLMRDQAEAEFARTLGIRKTIWLPGVEDEYGTDGHIDGIACFVRPGVLLFEDSAEESGPFFETTRANRRALEGQRDADGLAIEILSLRGAPPVDRGGRGEWGYCRSYINFYIANGGIVMPGFGIPEDAAARATLRDVFPYREIVQVDVSTLAGGGGGIHCITQQQPRSQ
jgi:agmatine deiminase